MNQSNKKDENKISNIKSLIKIENQITISIVINFFNILKQFFIWIVEAET
jgi:hypothetical protein